MTITIKVIVIVKFIIMAIIIRFIIKVIFKKIMISIIKYQYQNFITTTQVITIEQTITIEQAITTKLPIINYLINHSQIIEKLTYYSINQNY